MELRKEYFENSKEISLFGLYSWYYLPELKKSVFGEIEIKPTKVDLIRAYFIRYQEEVYGYSSGLAALNELHGTTQVPAVTDIKSNKVKKNIEYYTEGLRIRLHPSDVIINRDNYLYLKILDVIEEFDKYFETDIVECIKKDIQELNLREERFRELLNKYSSRTQEVMRNVFA